MNSSSTSQLSLIQSKSQRDILKIDTNGLDKLDLIIRILHLRREQRNIYHLNKLQRYFMVNFTYFMQLKQHLSQVQLYELFSSLQLEFIQAQNTVFHQGTTGRKMYLILQGSVCVLIKNKQEIQPKKESSPLRQKQKSKKELYLNKAELNPFEQYLDSNFHEFRVVDYKSGSQYFGEIAIQQRVPRTATVVTQTDCIFAILTYEAYTGLIQQVQGVQLEMKYHLLSSIQPFSTYTEQEMHLIAHTCEEIDYHGCTTIYKRYEKSTSVYIIIEGDVLVQKWVRVPYMLSATGSINYKEQIVNIGVYGRGSVVGDFELFLSMPTNGFVIRCSQAITNNQTKIIRAPIRSYIHSINQNMPKNWLVESLLDKYMQKNIRFNQLENSEIESNSNKTKRQFSKYEQVFINNSPRNVPIETPISIRRLRFPPPKSLHQSRADIQQSKSARKQSKYQLPLQILQQTQEQTSYFLTSNKKLVDEIVRKISISKEQHSDRNQFNLTSNSTKLRTEPTIHQSYNIQHLLQQQTQIRIKFNSLHKCKGKE